MTGLTNIVSLPTVISHVKVPETRSARARRRSTKGMRVRLGLFPPLLSLATWGDVGKLRCKHNPCTPRPGAKAAA